MNIYFKDLIISFFVLAFASPVLAKGDLDKLTSTLNRYRSSAMVTIQFKQTVNEDLTGKKSVSEGELNLAKGLLRLQNSLPDKNLIVLDGTYMWNEQAKSADFSGPAQVTKASIHKQGKSFLIFSNLLMGQSLSKSFKLTRSGQDAGLEKYVGDSLDKDSPIKKINLNVSTEKNEIASISYQDDIGNLTEVVFVKTMFHKELNRKVFTYKPAKGAQVTEL